MVLADLVDLPTATAALAPRKLSAGQLAGLPAAVAAASQAVRRWCGDRDFTRADYDEVLPVENGQVKLRQFPVNDLASVMGGRTPGLVVTNADPSAAVARVSVVRSGDRASGQVATGLTLTKTAGGATTAATVPISAVALATVQGLADAVAAVGGGWAAQVQGVYGAWPLSELALDAGVPAQSALPPGGGARLDLYAEAAEPEDFDPDAGLLSLGWAHGSPGYSYCWAGFDAGDARRRGWVRVRYNAGFDVVPASVQQATLVVAGDMLAALVLDGTLKVETIGDYSWEANAAVSAIPPSAMHLLAPWRKHEA